MRSLFTFLLLLSISAFSQTPEDRCKSIYDIATMERNGHQRIASREARTMASVNFDVKYYRCEWDVDPAVRYIKGKVTESGKHLIMRFYGSFNYLRFLC